MEMGMGRFDLEKPEMGPNEDSPSRARISCLGRTGKGEQWKARNQARGPEARCLLHRLVSPGRHWA